MWQEVKAAELTDNPVSIFQPNRARNRRGRSWECVLACGHTAYRPVRYAGVGLYRRTREEAAAKPPPTRVRCAVCATAARRAVGV